MKKPHVTHNSGKQEWYTPQYIVDAARQVMGSIDLDPASNPTANQIVQAATYYTKEQDGLTRPWFGNVWLNPPYDTRSMRAFSSTLITKYINKEFSQACVLINNATESIATQTFLCEAAAVCLLNHRVKFLGTSLKPEHTPLQGQFLIYFGSDTERFTSTFHYFLGTVLYLHPYPIKNT